MKARLLAAFLIGTALNALAVTAQIHTFEYRTARIHGDLHATSFTGDGSALTGVTGIASGLIFWVHLSSCPAGWTAVSMSGMAAVGVPSGGTINATVGTALTDLENRAVGTHNHTATTTITDPGHKPPASTLISPDPHHHTMTLSTSSAFGGTGDVALLRSGGTVTPTSLSISTSIVNQVTGVSIATTLANAGSVAGTNLPSDQEILCKKN